MPATFRRRQHLAESATGDRLALTGHFELGRQLVLNRGGAATIVAGAVLGLSCTGSDARIEWRGTVGMTARGTIVVTNAAGRAPGPEVTAAVMEAERRGGPWRGARRDCCRMKTSSGTVRWVSLVAVLAGCAEADERWSGSVETLPNGATRVTNPAQGVWREGSAWALVPELRLGEVEGSEATVFGSISGLAVNDAGRIYVLDRQANELRIFARDGRHVRSVGRAGGGPGEYQAANGLFWLSPDTLVVVDQQGGRYSFLSREGEYLRSVPRRLGFYGWAFNGAYHNGRVYERSTVRTNPNRPRAMVGNDPDQRPALFGTSLRASDSTAQAGVDTVLLAPPTGTPYESFSVRTERGGMVMGVPFAAAPVYHLDSAGNVWHGHGSDFRIVRSSFAGDTIMEIVLDAVPAPVTEAELAEWESGGSVAQFRQMGGRIDLDRIPKVKPFFNGLYLDPERYLWVSVPAGPMETVFAVFDPEGRYLGSLKLDGLRRDTFLQPVVSNGKLYLVGRDELDVQRVYVFRIEK